MDDSPPPQADSAMAAISAVMATKRVAAFSRDIAASGGFSVGDVDQAPGELGEARAGWIEALATAIRRAPHTPVFQEISGEAGRVTGTPQPARRVRASDPSLGRPRQGPKDR